MADLLPCPFCGAGDTRIVENCKVWLGTRYGEPASVSVRHHCEPSTGQPSRMIERVGRDEASAIEAWNRRTASPASHEQVEALRKALAIFDWLERRSIYQDAQVKEAHDAVRAALHPQQSAQMQGGSE